MQLKLRVGVGDTLTIDVEPTDTFQDLTDRLYNLGGVKVDLSQLRNNDKPFDMSTNVMSYFLPKSKEEQGSVENVRPKRHCRLCSDTISNTPIFLFEEQPPSQPGPKVTLLEKVNSSLPIHVSVRDPLPKQICENCHGRVNKSFDFMRKVIDAQKTLEQVYSVKPKEKPVTSYHEESCCPLCTVGRFKQVDCKLKVINGQAKSEKVLRKEVVISVPKGTNNVRKEVNVNRPVVKEDSVETEFYEDDIVTGFWDPSQDSDSYGNKKMRKRIKVEDDADWTIDEEYVPVSRRGRPRGTKNKPKVHVPVVQKSCTLCGWLGADYDMFAHAINQHCQPDMGYFPCPLCKTNHTNEMFLESHIEKHNSRRNDK